MLPLGSIETRNDDPFARGVALYRSGDAQQALAALTEAEQAAGHDASAPLLFDRALAALATGELRVAETCAEKMAARGGATFYGLRDFLLGNAAFIAGERAEAEGALAEADPTALRLAIQHVRKARESWIRALVTREDWPAARRNIARADARLRILEIKRDAAEEARKAKQESNQKKKQRGPTETEEREAEMQRARVLSTQDIAALLARIEETESEKRRLRRAERSAKQRGVERDW